MSTLIMTLGSSIYAMPMSTVSLPSSHVLLSIFLPQAIALHCPVLEISHVILLPKRKQSSPVRFVIHEITVVCGT